VRRGEIETANRVGVDEDEGREEAGEKRATIGGDSVGRVRTRRKERERERERVKEGGDERTMRERFNQTNAYK